MNSAVWTQVASSWGAAMLSASWQGAIGIAIVYLICRLVPRLSPAAQCWLWRLAYLKLFVSLFWAASLHVPVSPPKVNVAIAGQNYDLLSEMASIPASAGTAQPSGVFGVAVFILWAAGCAWCIWRVLCEIRETIRLRTACRDLADADLANTCAVLSGKMAVTRPKLMEHDGSHVPLIVGLREAAIVLPHSFREEYGTDQMRMILAHELAHLKRGDLKWAWLPRLARCIFFFHPLVWLAEHEWQQSQEMACDREVLRLDQISPTSYGAVLLQVVQQKRAVSSSGLAVMQVAESYSTVKRRLMAMKETGITSRLRLTTAAALASAAGVIALVPWRVVAQESAKVPAGGPVTLRIDGYSMTGKLADALNLTAIQQSKIRAIQEYTVNQIRRTLTPQQSQRLDQLAANSQGGSALLSLTPGQEKKLAMLKEQMGEKARAIESDSTLTPQQKEERFKALKADHEKIFASVLTMQQLDEAKRIHSLKSDGDMPQLTPDQEEQMKRLKMEFGEVARQIEEDPSITPREKKERMEKIHHDVQEGLHRILTPEQLRQMDHQKAIREMGPYSIEAISTLDNLTPAQKQKLESIHRDAHNKLIAALTPAQRERLIQIQQGK